MKRFIRIFETGEWIDTLKEKEEFGKYYFIEPNENGEDMVYYYSDEHGTNTLVGTLEEQSDKFVVQFIVFTQYQNDFGDCEEISEEETIEYTCETYEKAVALADRDKEGWRGSYVAVYINDEYYRDYEVE